ncbi:TetR/AcrR family transcriptional regulator [Sphingomicrobium sediminis]|uniref:TetR/AcrR family transcriptional regulator n=1 Tax=Sphingomicrobium sediminis TaxID=2950949 RepID=A0A9X2J416_9SPHN|nr:TetR/AcrR family transcriptional regulator [Sphingomicrobium sediminis]MCM8556767.1 TetR/AcrR family transcriptional regulator [Sphingomicrobium sediminis]
MRKQPVQERSQKRLAELMATAERLIIEQGVADFSVRAVLRETGTSMAAYYEFFPTKAALLRSLVEKYGDQLNKVIARALIDRRQDTPEQRIDAGLDAIFAFYVDNPIALRLWPAIHYDNALSELDRRDTERNADLLLAFLEDIDASDQSRETARWMVMSSCTIMRHAARLDPPAREQLIEKQRMALKALVGITRP